MRILTIPLLLLLSFAFSAAGQTKPSDKKEEKAPAVSIKAMQYAPATLTIKVGQTVTWTNNDDRDHTVVSDDKAKTFKSDNISPKGSYRFKFEKKGKYTYSCSYHPRMKGTIVVGE